MVFLQFGLKTQSVIDVMSETRFLKTSAGIFRVLINDDKEVDRDTRDIRVVGKLISVGGKNTCVFIKISNNSSTAILNNVKTSADGCEMNNKKIAGENTVLMVKLAFTIVKEVSPHVKILELDDSSTFTCLLDNGRSFAISIALYELAFHQSTWYERHFNAKLLTEEVNQAYLKAKEGFSLPKPEYYDFQNKSLNELLMPIYEKTKTWKEFFDEIYKIENKCRIMFPWYIGAVAKAMGGLSCSNQTRIIDIYTLPSIEYKEVKLGSRGGTRRKKAFMEYGEPIDIFKESPNDISRNDIYMLPFTKADLKQIK